jgi:N-glycosylase/DNA lyase
MPAHPRYRDIDVLRREYAERGGMIRLRLGEFARVPPAAYFYELAYCLCTPQSSAVNAGKAIARLQADRFLECGDDPVDALRGPGHYIRFHRTKARHLIEARAAFPHIAQILSEAQGRENGAAVRVWLVKNVRGLGWKEASHFLRNTGWRGLAILDRHILRNLRRHGVLREIPRTLTGTRYLAIENRFRRFGNAIGIDIDELDLLFWSRETGEILK